MKGSLCQKRKVSDFNFYCRSYQIDYQNVVHSQFNKIKFIGNLFYFSESYNSLNPSKWSNLSSLWLAAAPLVKDAWNKLQRFNEKNQFKINYKTRNNQFEILYTTVLQNICKMTEKADDFF